MNHPKLTPREQKIDLTVSTSHNFLRLTTSALALVVVLVNCCLRDLSSHEIAIAEICLAGCLDVSAASICSSSLFREIGFWIAYQAHFAFFSIKIEKFRQDVQDITPRNNNRGEEEAIAFRRRKGWERHDEHPDTGLSSRSWCPSSRMVDHCTSFDADLANWKSNLSKNPDGVGSKQRHRGQFKI